MRLVDSVLMISGLRLNFVQNLVEEESFERFPQPMIIPNLTKEVRAVDLCVGSYFPVLIAHRVVLKSRPLGFMTASSHIKETSTAYQQQIITGLFSGSFIDRRKAFEIQKKRKRATELEEVRKKSKQAEPKASTAPSSSPPQMAQSAAIASPNTSPRKPKPGLTRSSPLSSPSKKPKISANSQSVIKARRKLVHTMPKITFKRIELKKAEVPHCESRKPLALPVYSMLSSSDSEEELRESLVHETSKDSHSTVLDGEESNNEHSYLSDSENDNFYDTTDFPSHSSPEKPLPDTLDLNQNALYQSTLASNPSSSPLHAPPPPPASSSSSSASEQLYNSFSSFISDASRLPEKLLGHVWTQSKPVATEPSKGKPGATMRLNRPAAAPPPTSSLSQYLTKMYKRDSS